MLKNFNTKSVVGIAGVSMRQLHYWDETHLIKPSIREASGYGSVRLYSFTDLIQLKVAKRLRDEGISLQKIRKSVNYLKKNMPEVERPLAELKFLTDGDTIFVLTGEARRIIDTLRSGQVVFSIALGEIVEALRGEVMALQAERKYTVRVRSRAYNVVLHPDTEDGGFWVECPALPGCVSQGDTVEEALEMIKDAIEGHIEVVGEKKKSSKAA